MGGLDSSKYCPECGKKKVEFLEEKYLDFSDHIGLAEPFDPLNPPVLLTEEQLKKLLRLRSGSDRIEDKELVKKMKQAGIKVSDLPDDDWDSDDLLTETETEQMNLAEKILTLKGKDLNAFPDVTCRQCGSRFVAALTYTMIRENAEIENTMLAETASQDPLVLKTNYVIKSGDSRNAFICLQCGMEFGL